MNKKKLEINENGKIPGEKTLIQSYTSTHKKSSN